MTDVVFCEDNRLEGIVAGIRAVTDTRIICANRIRKTLVTVAIFGGAPNVSIAQMAVQAESAVFAYPPQALAVDATSVYALSLNTVSIVPNNSTPLDVDGFTPSTFAVDCVRPHWILVNGNFLVLPFGWDGVQVYTLAGVFVASYRGVLASTNVAFFDQYMNLFLIDGITARGVMATQAANGTLAFEPTFVTPGCKNAVGALRNGRYIAIACPTRLALLDTMDSQSQPTFAGAKSYPHVNGIAAVGSDQWWIASDDYITDQADRFDYVNNSALFIPAFGVYALSGRTGRVIGEAAFNAITPTVVTGGGDSGETFYVLQEDATSKILEEDNTGALLKEDAP